MRCVILESPYRGRDWAETYRFQTYRNACIRDSVNRGESPYASHAIFPGALDDNNPEERQQGIDAGYVWWDKADAIVFYLDHGMSRGMQFAYDYAKECNYHIEERRLANN